LTVLNVDDKIIQKILESGFNDFEDAVPYFTAVENKMDYIVSIHNVDRLWTDFFENRIFAALRRENASG
jgi:hypothetical protein